MFPNGWTRVLQLLFIIDLQELKSRIACIRAELGRGEALSLPIQNKESSLASPEHLFPTELPILKETSTILDGTESPTDVAEPRRNRTCIEEDTASGRT